MAARLLTVLLLTTALIGCRGSGDDDDDDNTGIDGGGGGDDVSIYEIQDGTVGEGAAVNIRGVVVTAIDAYGNDAGGSFWVAEPADHPTHGRAYSGVQIYPRNNSLVAELAVGDLVDIESAVVKEFALNCDNPEVDCTDTTQTLTEIDSEVGVQMIVTVVGAGTAPAPVVVEPQALAADPNEAEKWEGVLIQFDDVAVTQAPRQVGSSDTTAYEMRVTGPMIVRSSFAALPDLTRDDCLASVSGILNYFYNWQLLPRATADVIAAGDATACLYETSAGDCDDGNDNDFDGFTDCEDFSCVDANPDLCVSAVTVVDIQNGTIAENTVVMLDDVVVTAVSSTGSRVWVQDADSTADFNGIQLYRGSVPPALDSQIVIGAVIDVTGRVQEYPFDTPATETQLSIDTASQDLVFVSAGATPAVRTGVSVGALAAADGGETYEGMLVELTNVKVTNPDSGFGEFTISDGTDSLQVDEVAFGYSLPVADTCYATLRGVMGEAYGTRRIQPTSADDMVTGGTCL